MSTKEEVKSLIFSLAWCSWSNWHTKKVVKVMGRLGFTEEETMEQLVEFKGIINSPAGEGSPK